MKPLVSSVLAALVLVVFSSLASAEKRVALVIGNGAYQHATVLTNPANDAQDIAAALAEVGFDTIVGLDLDKRAFELKVREFARKLGQADVGLLFYAGHGLQVSGQNYLLPVDAKLESERDLDFEALRLDFVLKQMELERENKTNIVFLDACRDNPIARTLARTMGTRSASVGQGLAQVQSGIGTFISYSTQPGNVALDGAGRNSPFAAALVKRVKEPGRNLTAVMIDVRKDVLTQTAGKQVPWDHSSLTGDFYFHLASAPSAAPKPGPASVSEAEALQQRLRRLEDELKKKSDLASTAAAVQLAQLKDRARRLEEDTRADFQQIFEVQRNASREANPARQDQARTEVSRIQLRIARRGQEQKDVRAQVERLTAEIAPSAAGDAASKKAD